MSTSEPSEPIGATGLRHERQKRLDAAKTYYGQVINRLWGGNVAGALATLTAIGTLKREIVGYELPLSLSCFLIGLLALGIGSISSLWYEVRVIRNLERAETTGDPVLKRDLAYVRRPSEDAFYKLETMLALLAALSFLFGTACGLLLIFRIFR